MRYANIKWSDDINGDGLMLSLFVSGCPHHCEGCFSSQTWDYSFGEEYTKETQNSIIDYFNKNSEYYNGLSILGGEPLCEENFKEVMDLISLFRGSFEDKKIFVWTGYLFDNLAEKHGFEVFGDIDVLVDGKFELDKKDLNLKLRGSSNQRAIDVKRSLECGEVVELDKN